MAGLFNKRWIGTTVKAADCRYDKLVDEQNDMINDALDMFKVSDIVGMLADLDLEDEQYEYIMQVFDAYKKMLVKYLEISSMSMDMAIERDNRIRNIEKQNEEILEKLDKLSEKKTTK